MSLPLLLPPHGYDSQSRLPRQATHGYGSKHLFECQALFLRRHPCPCIPGRAAGEQRQKERSTLSAAKAADGRQKRQQLSSRRSESRRLPVSPSPGGMGDGRGLGGTADKGGTNSKATRFVYAFPAWAKALRAAALAAAINAHAGEKMPGWQRGRQGFAFCHVCRLYMAADGMGTKDEACQKGLGNCEPTGCVSKSRAVKGGVTSAAACLPLTARDRLEQGAAPFVRRHFWRPAAFFWLPAKKMADKKAADLGR